MFRDLLRERLAGIVEVSDVQAAALEAHYELLLKWNKVVSLTSVKGERDIVERHYCEAAFAAARLPVGAWSVVDVGSGPGFPGIPMAVLRPECRFALVESHQRKAVFLREASRGMENVRVLAVRAEGLEETFDWVVSRAVSYEDLTPVLQKVGRNAELLSGGEEPPGLAGWSWEAPVALPWGKQRFLRIGHRG